MKSVADKGNYRGYYKFRGEADKRAACFAKEWFENKVCLDIGCNEGSVTMEIARNYAPKSILGIDVDKILIENAQSKVKRAIYEFAQKNPQQINREDVKHSAPSGLSFLPRSLIQKNSASQLLGQTRISTGVRKQDIVTTDSFPHNIHFICKSFMDLSSGVAASSSSSSSNVSSISDGTYDTVLCLSVVKWIHLNEGDAGLLAFFHRLFQLVRHGGIVILEFQPWKSYLNNKGVTEHIKATFAHLQIRPEHFAEILTVQVGFVLEANIGTSLESAKGFDRPIFVLRRPAFGVSAVHQQSFSASSWSNGHQEADSDNTMMCEEDNQGSAAQSVASAAAITVQSNNAGMHQSVVFNVAAQNDRKRKFNA